MINRNDALQYAHEAGFDSATSAIIVSIAQAESGLNENARHVNTNGTVDRGILQLNSYYHQEVVDNCAYDAHCSFQQAYRITNGGKNFGAWATYNSGAYIHYLGSTSGLMTSITTTGAGANADDFASQLSIMGEKIAVFVLSLLLIFIGFVVIDASAVRNHLKVIKHAVIR